MTERSPSQDQPRNSQPFFGQDFMAWMRQGLAELREVFTPSHHPDSIAQPAMYGAVGVPPPSTVARALSQDQQKGYSLDQLKDRGREILSEQGNEQQRDNGNEHGR